MARLKGHEAEIFINGIHSDPIITVTFKHPTIECEEIANTLAFFFEGFVLFCDRTRHFVIKTNKGKFASFVGDGLQNAMLDMSVALHKVSGAK